MASEDHGLFQDSPGDGFSHLAAHVVALQASDNTAFDVSDNGFMDIKYGTCVHGQILDSHLGSLGEHHVQHIVSVSHMMMEGNRHSILQTCLFNGFF